MKKFYLVMVLASFAMFSYAQVTTNEGSGLAPTYGSLAAAITALNAATITGPVVITLTGIETAPAGGYSITQLNGTATNTIIIQGSSSTITAPSPAGAAGALNDAIFKIIGGDWITIQNFTMLENAANTTTAAASNNMTEFGVALFYATATNGCQNITINNNIIDLNRTYQNTFGIYSNSTHTATAVSTGASATGAAGGNHNLQITGNSITDVNLGIVIVGPLAAADMNNVCTIGGSPANANTITNFGTTGTFSSYINVSGTVNGILVRNTNNFTISHNTVTSSAGGTTVGTLNGIQIPVFSIAPTGTFTNSINFNSISLQSGLIAGVINGINVLGTSATTTSTININNNNFHTSGHTVAGTGAITFITQAGTHLNQSISNNTFTDITVNTTGSVTFILNTNTLPAGGVKNINTNSIVNAFNKTGAGGTVAGHIDAASSPSGTTVNNNNNNFSNITVTGATAITGWSNTDGGAPTKTVQGNTFNNLTGGTSAIIGMTIGYATAGVNSFISGNTITNITGQGAITGLIVGTASAFNVHTNTINNLSSTGTGGAVIGLSITAGSNNVYNHEIHTLSTTAAAAAVTGISVTAATLHHIYRNKIYNLSSSTTGTTAAMVNGITISAGTAVYAYNNFISDLRASSSTSIDAIRGINITSSTTSSTVGIYYNTIYLDAKPGGGNFGTSGILHTFNTTATTATLDMRNNIIVNKSTPSGTGLTVAFRRSASTNLNNVSTLCNNNDFFAPTIMHDGTTAYTIASYKTLVAPRDAASFSEEPPFVEINATPYDIHLTAGNPTQCESGGQRITAPIAITTDFDNEIRTLETGYLGTGSAPDVGADEGEFIGLDLSVPSIVYTPLGNGIAAGTRLFSNVGITDASSVDITSGTRPRVYYKKSTDANDDTGWKFVEASGSGGSPFSFTIDYTLLNSGNVTAGNIVQYFVVAQDLAGTPNVGINSGNFAAAPVSVDLTSAAFPITGTINSYTIVGTISGLKTVGSGGDYPTLTGAGGAFADINAKVVSGNIVLEIISNLTETSDNALNQWTEEPPTSNYTLSILPNAATIRTISGTFAGGLIRLNGADRVTIDGRSGGAGRYLTFNNTSTATNSAAIQVISLGTGAGAVNNTIRNCNILAGSNTVTSTFGIFAGGATISTTGTGADNDNLTISDNAISKAYFGIFARGTAGVTAGGLDGLNINNNIIGSVTAADYVLFRGIDVQGAVAPTISGNEIFNLILATSVSNAGIDLGANVNDAVVSKNLIRSIKSTSTSGYGAFGINISATTTNNIRIDNNVIYDLITSNYSATSTSFNAFGIRITGGTNHKVYYNSVNLFGPVTGGTVAGMSAAFLVSASTVTGLDVRNNIFANSTEFTVAGAKSYAAYVVSGTVFANINNNDYFASGTYGVLGFYGADITTIAGWRTASSQDVNSISADPLFNTNTNLQPQVGSPVLAAGTNISGITSDFLGVPRTGNTSIGAFETGIDIVGPSISLTPLGYTTVPGERTLDVIITDFSGVPTAGTGLPVLYWSINTTALYTSAQAVHVSGNTYRFTFGAGAVSQDLVRYYIVAQDNFSPPNFACSPSAGASGFSANPPAVTTSPTSPYSYYITSPLAGIYTIDNTIPTGGTNFQTFQDAFASLNLNGVGTGGVTFNVTAGQTFTANNSAANTAALQLSATGTASSPIIFQRFGGGANPIIQSKGFAGGTLDLCIWLRTGDYITFDGIDIENTGTVADDWLDIGIGMQGSTTDGGFYNTIKNCKITLNKANPNSRGIWVVTNPSATVAAAAHRYNTFLNNRIENTYTGYWFSGHATHKDIGNIIDATPGAGIITNFSGGGTIGYGIYVANGDSMTIQNTIIENVTAQTSTLYGIYGLSTSHYLTVKNNTLRNFTGTSVIYPVYILGNFGLTQGNLIENINAGSTQYGIYHSGNDCQVVDNIVQGFSNTGTSAAIAGVYMTGASRYKVINNTIKNINASSTSTTYCGIYAAGGTNRNYIQKNTIESIVNVTGHANAIYLTTASDTLDISGNSMSGIVSNNTGTTYRAAAIFSAATGPVLTNIYNNLIYDVKAPASGTTVTSSGMYLQGASTNRFNIYYNTVYLDYISTNALNQSGAIYAALNPTYNFVNNIFVNNTDVTIGFGAVSFIYGSTTYAKILNTTNNNLYYAGTPGAKNLIFFDGTNPEQTLAGYQTRISPRETGSVTENPPFASSVSPYDLHLSGSTYAESSGQPISGIDIDFDNNIRFGSSGYSGTSTFGTDIGAYEFDGIVSFTCTTPNPGNTLTSANNICFGESVILSLQNLTAGSGFRYQWQSSLDGSTWADITGATAIQYTVAPLVETFYRCNVTCLIGPETVASGAIQIIFASAITSTVPATRCGTGTVSLSATTTAGLINWYTAPTGGVPIGSGSPFTTPVISNTTNYYVASGTFVNQFLGRLTHVGGSGTSLTTYGQDFTVTKSIILNSVDVISSTGTSITISLFSSGGTTQLQTTGAQTVTAGATVAINLGWSLAPGTYRLCATGMTGNFIRETSGITYPILLGSIGQINGFVSTITGSVTTTAAYYFMYNWNMADICESPRIAVQATVNPAPAITASASQNIICLGQSTNLNVSSPNDPNYTYTWTPGPLTGAAQTVSPSVATTYTVNAVDNTSGTYAGCVNVATVAIAVNQIPSAVSITPSSATNCQGVVQQLTASGGTLQTVSELTLGTGSSTTTGNSTGSTLGPNPFQSYYGGSKQQMLITASELSPLGIVNGSVINSISIQMNTVEARTLNSLVVKMKNTSTTAFSSTTFETGLTTVRNAANYTPTTAWSAIGLDNSFTYTGGSLLIEINFSNNDAGGSGTSTAFFGTTSYASTLLYRADNQTAAVVDAATTASFTAYTQRNNIRFTATITSPTFITWSPTTLLFTDNPPTIAYDPVTYPNLATVYAQPSVTTTYTATSTSDLGCTNSNTVLVTVVPLVNAGTVSGITPLSVGLTTTYSSNGDAGGSWSSTNTAVATVDASTGLVTAIAAGTTDITYTISSGCGSPVSSLKTLTVTGLCNAGTVSGTSPLCIGATATYTSNGDAGGSWSSTNTSVATVDVGTGLVTTLGAGTSDITYTVSIGCGSPVSSFQTLTVDPNVTAGTVSGTSPLCIGATAIYTSNGTAGGSWSSINTSVATVDAGTGLVTAVGSGTTNITYTVNSGCASPVSSFQTLTVDPNVTAGTVSGTSPLCIGATAIYTSNGTAGGSWSSINTSVATVDAGTGLVTAVGSGTTNITYTVNSGCASPVSSFQTLTVDPNVTAGTVSGTSPLCIGATAIYTSNGTAGGSWSSTNTSVATVDVGTGLVTTLGAGTSDITYTVSIGCASPVSSFQTLTVDPNVTAGTVSGTSPLCIGATATYTSNGTAGGSWSSTNTSVATVDAGTGLVTTLGAGTSDITYTVSIGCASPVSSFQTLTVDPNVTAGTVSGTSPLCIGATATYTSNGTAGGSWSSTNTSVATVDAGTGLVTTLGAGTSDITYTVSIGCGSPFSAFQTLTVDPNVTAGTVSGTSPLCIGATAIYTSNGTTGGSWSSINTSVATVDAGTGLVTAVGSGTTNITYTVNSGCGSPFSSFQTLTVDPNVTAATVSGTSPLCIGATATYTSNGTAGGSWSSTNTSVATVDAGTGLVTAVGAGTTNITYTVSSGCGSPVFALQALTVSPNVTAGTVSGTSPLCIGAEATYTSNGTSGGSWSSSNTAVATVVSGTGVVTAVGAGTTNITYTVNSGCGSPVFALQALTVSPNVTAGTVSGTSPLCIGATATYTSNGTAGGSWSSSNTAVATVVSGTGLVTAVGAGTTNITYTVSSGCGSPVSALQALTVSPNVTAGTVSGTSPLCIGATAAYISNGTAGGSWSSTNTSVATVDAGTGLVTAVGAGTTNITYTVSSGCGSPFSSFQTLTVDPNVTAGTVSGTSPLCIGATATYTSNGTAGGSWSSSNTAVATVVSGTGLVTAVGAGTTNITYTVNSGCGSPVSALQALTVSPNVTAGTVSGTSPLCIGATATYTSNGTAGGSWSSSNTAVATVVSATGVVTAVGAGTTNITYTVSSGCGSPVFALQALTVSPNVTAGTVSGTSPLCIGATATYTSNGTAGGSWSSSNTAVATVVSATGVVTAVGAGTTNITYTVSSGCGSPVLALQALTVSPNVTAGTVSGTSPLCIGATATYTSNGTSGGSWSSTNTAVATVNPTTGFVTAVSVGTSNITYTVNSGCGSPVFALQALTVSPNVTAGTVSGTSPLCIGATATYTSNGTAGGSWSSSNTAVATVVSATGLVTAVGAGTTNITYTVSSGCGSPVFALQALTVSPNANAGTVSGISPLLAGATATFTSNGDAGGTWSSTNTSVATVNPTTGFVTALSAGTSNITYTVNSGCNSPVSSFMTLSVGAVNAGNVSGTSPLCIGQTATYSSDGDPGGTWTSTNTSVATVNSTTGFVTTLSAGTTEITYTVLAVSSFKVLTVSPNVIAGTVSGTSPLCIGATATYTSNGTSGGSWSSSNTAVATVVSGTGLVTAVGTGTTNITYTVNSGCGSPVSALQALTVSPNVTAGTVSGTSPLCIGATATYTSNGTAGGSWSSSNTAVATVVSATGLVTAVGAGTTNITYTVSSGCGSPVFALQALTVSPNVTAGTVSGTSPLCIGATATYTSNGTSGGSWSSTNTAVATVTGITGLVTAVGVGNTNITYTVNSGCGSPVSALQALTVSPNVTAGTVSGTSPLCIGATATYTSNGTSGGSWSSSNTAVATVVSATGVVTAVGAGTTNITYTVSSGCGSPVFALQALTVSPNVTAGTVSGTSPLCIGATATYTSNGTAGGSWSSSNTAVATVVSGTGLVTAVGAGTTNITYTVNSGCGSPVSALQALTVSPNVTAGTVSGTSPLCIGATVTYTSNGTSGGSWSSSNTAVATVVSGTGLVTAVGAGTTNITYTVSSGCGSPVSALQALTVSPNVIAGTVSGTSPLCIGATSTYTSNGTSGGSWSSSNTAVATVVSGTGLVTAVGAGTTNITYTVNSGCGSPVSALQALTVSPNVTAGTVSGTSPLCIGATATYTSNGTSGGSWSSSNTAVATVVSGTGLVTAVGAGTTNITYTVSSGCGSPVSALQALTVSPNANAGTVSGTSPLLVGANATFTSNGDAGGTWSSTNTSVATVNPTTGFVTALSAGTSNITYTVNSGCNSPVSSFMTLSVGAVNAGNVSGTSPLCIGQTATYSSDGDPGGTWTSTNTSVATVNSTTGFVTALSAGTTEITYTVLAVSSFKVLTVSPNVTAGTVSGTSPLCIGATATYTSNGTSGGSWSSSNTAVATVVSGTGLVTAVGAGTTNITYTVNSGCGSPVSALKALTVSPNVIAGTVSGTSPLCIGATATYTSNGTSGGSWSSTNTAVATVVSGTGLVTAVGAGTTNITYTVSSGCGSPVSALQALTVSPNVTAGTVSGTSPLCIGATATYTSNGTSGGSWSSTNTSVATVNPTTGFVTAVSVGTSNITYTVSSGCGSPVSALKALTVSPNVTAGTVSGTSPLCIGATATYTSNGTSGGSWSSTNTSVATVNPTTGFVTAVSVGTSNITYTVSSGCGSPVSALQALTVSPNVTAGTVSGTSPLCIGTTATYTSNGTSGGSWSSSNTAVATVVSGTGLVTAVGTGTSNITYTVSSGCGSPVSALQALTVSPNVTAGTVSGTSPLCIGATATYTSNGTAGGSWSSSNTAVATVVSGTGLVTAVGAGTTNITYTVNSGCGSPVSALQALTVSPNVTAGTVSGTSPLCIGATATYTSNGTSGGSWSSSNTAVATVVSGTGLVTAVGAGTTNITYTVSSGCGSPVSALQALTVSPNVIAGTVSGTSPLCIGATSTYTSNGTSGGSWSSSNTAVATVVSGTGLVTAVGAGTTNITYTVNSGCGSPVSALLALTVSPNVTAGTVSGTSPLCIGATATYTSNGTSGGSWSSTNTSVATVNPTTGFVTAVSVGTSNITYTVSSGCGSPVSALQALTVSPNANAGTVSGTSPLLVGANATFTSNGDAGGTWSSTNTSVATVNPTTGFVTALSAGTSNITYTVNSGCNSPVSSFMTLSVGAINAGNVSGTSPLCIGQTGTYSSDGDPGGTWTSTNTSVATVNSTTGFVTAVGAGTTEITYTVLSVSSFKILTVSPNVTAGTVSGTSPLCIGAIATYTSNGTAGGSWSSSNTAVATVVSGTGLVTAVGAGTTNITYTVNSGCGSPVSALKALTVSPNANAGTVSGTSPLSVGGTATYTSNGDAGGTWSSTNTSVATVNPTTGFVTALSTGTSNITYTVNSGCNSPVSSFMTLSVGAVNAGNVSGTSPLCIGQTGTYSSDGDPGGTWTSTNTSVATVNSTTGFVTAVGAGTTEITYTVLSVSSFKILTVSPNVTAGTVSGTSPLCIGAIATYTSNGTAGGSWSSSNTAVATVTGITGLVTAVGVGNTNITYTVSGGCGSPVSALQALTVSPNVTAGTVSGTSPLCIGATATYTSNGTSGGSWSSSNTAVATVVSGTGLVTAVGAGTTNITYTVNSGCGSPVSALQALTVSPNVTAGTVSGTSPLCIGATATYTSNGTSGGSWSSTNTSVATVNPTTGFVTAVSVGTSNITYTVSSGCGSPVSALQALTVSPNVTAGTVSGTSPLCIGATATYTSNGTSGGSWSSTNTSVATVNPTTGFVTAVSVGTSNITYTVSSGCGSPVSALMALTVSPNVTAGTVSGTSPLCIGATVTYTSNGTSGGSWSSTNTSVATVNPTTGFVTAVSVGTSNITYTVSSGCGSPVSALQALTVSPNVTAGTVSGTSPLCIGATATYTSNGTAGGSWSSSNTAVATVVSGTGLVTAVGAGTTNITYTVSSGCGSPVSALKALTVSPNANAGTVSGTSPLSVGGTATYTSNGDAGGSWSSTNTSVATVNPTTGFVTAISVGTSNITYTINTGCNNPVSSFKTLTVVIGANPGTVSGTSPLCIGQTATYSSDGDPGGTWTSTNTSVATVNPTTGFVTALSAGTANITYTIGASSSFATLIVKPLPPCTITGPNYLIRGETDKYSADAGNTTYLWVVISGNATIFGSNNSQTVYVTPNSGALFTLQLTTTLNGCVKVCEKVIEILPDDLYCTYGEGYYGNAGGLACNGTNNTPNKFDTKTTITNALNNVYAGGVMRIGNSSNFITISAATLPLISTDVLKVIEYLPGDGNIYTFTQTVLNKPVHVNGPISAVAFRDRYTKTVGNKNKPMYKMDNDLLVKTITLGINLGIQGTLGDFNLLGGLYLVTVDAVGGCGSKIPKVCTPTYDPYNYFWIDATLVNALGTNKTVAGLFALANEALAGSPLPAGITLTMIKNHVDIINKAFDECKLFVKYSATKGCPSYIRESTANLEKGITVNVYPNPSMGSTTFKFVATSNTKAMIEIYSLKGDVVAKIFEGDVEQGVEYKATINQYLNAGIYMYVYKDQYQVARGKFIRVDDLNY